MAVRSHFVIENQTLSKDVWFSVLSVRWLQVHNKTYTSDITVIENNTLALSSFKTTPSKPMDRRNYGKKPYTYIYDELFSNRIPAKLKETPINPGKC